MVLDRRVFVHGRDDLPLPEPGGVLQVVGRPTEVLEVAEHRVRVVYLRG